MHIIKNIERVETGLFSREPIAGHGTWFVYKNARGKLHLVESGNRISQIELKADGYSTRYSVAQGSYSYKHSAEYQSKDPGRAFQINVEMNLAVADPFAVVQSDVQNIQQYMDGNISFWIEQIAGDYRVEDFQELKAKMHHMAQHTSMVKEIQKKGLSVSQLKANVRLGNDDWQFYQRQLKIKQEAELVKVQLEEKQKIDEIERQRRLKEEQEQRERDRIKKEQDQKNRDRLAKLKDNEGIERLILERSEENKENLDILLQKDQDNREYERKLEQERIEHERRLELERIEHEKDMMKSKMDMMKMMMETSIKGGHNDPELLVKMMGILNETSSPSSLLESREPEKIGGWGGGNAKLGAGKTEESKNDDGWE